MSIEAPLSPPSVAPPEPRLFLSYSSRDRDAVVAIRRALAARNINTFFDRDDLTPGQPWFDELEAALQNAQAAAVFIGRDGLGSVQKREMQFALARQANAEYSDHKFPVVPVLLPDADSDTVSGFLALNTWVDLRRSVEDAEALTRLASVFRQQVHEQPQQSPLAICPFRGLNAFREEDAQLYFGRETVSKELFDKLLRRDVVTLIGRSGSGKSSVAQAGLLPLLRRAKPPARTWEILIFTPGSKPFHRLAAQLVPLWSPPGRSRTDIGVESEKLGNSLATDVPLSGFVDEALRHLPDTDRLLVIADQFEELFTLTTDPDQRKRLVEHLLAATRDTRLSLVVTMRADFYSQAIAYPDLAKSMSDGIVNVVDMTPEERRRAVEQPALCAGLSFQSGLVDRVLEQVEVQPGSLPLLEYALTELWQRRHGNQLTHQAYDAIGGIEGAISSRAETQFEKLTPAQQQIALPALSRLVRVSSASEEGTDSRQVVPLADLSPDAQTVMRNFAERDARLLVTDRDEASNQETVEVAHEALIHSWGRLKNWIDQDREFLLWRQRLQFFLTEWKRQGRDESALLRGVAPLKEGNRWLRERESDFTEDERAFIAASLRIPEKSKRLKRWLLVAAVIAGLATGGWWSWTRTERYQIWKIKRVASQSLGSAEVSAGYSYLSALVFAGADTEAVATAEKIQDPGYHSSALVTVATALAKAGNTTGALATAGKAVTAAEKIQDPGYRSSTLVTVATVLAKAGNTTDALATAEKAVAAAEKIADLGARSSALATVARALARAGNTAEALATAEKALAAAEKVPDPAFRAYALEPVAEAFAELGNTTEALATVGKIDIPSEAVRAVDAVVMALAKAGKTTEVLAWVEAIPDPNYRSDWLAAVAMALAKAGNTVEALATAKQALAAAEKIQDPGYRSVTLVTIAEALATAGDTTDVLGTVKKIPNTVDVSPAISAIVMAFAMAGNTTQAVATAEKIQDPSYRSSALVAVATALAKTGNTTDALATAEKTQDLGYRSVALAAVAKALAKAGKTKEAVAAAGKIEDVMTRVSAMLDVAEAAMKAGNPETARTIALAGLADIENLGNDVMKSRLLARLAAVLAQSHSYREARLTADLCTLSDKINAYAGILQAYTIQQHPERAKLFQNAEQNSD